MRTGVLPSLARFPASVTDELISFPDRHSKPVSRWLILGHASTICADRISWDYTKGQTERRARPLHLSRRPAKRPGGTKMHPLTKQSSQLSHSHPPHLARL